MITWPAKLAVIANAVLPEAVALGMSIANQLLPGRLRARGRIDYFSSITTSQTFNTNVNDASRNQRSFGANVVGAWGNYSLNGTFDRSENFYNKTSSAVFGNWPQVTVSRNERPIG